MGINKVENQPIWKSTKFRINKVQKLRSGIVDNQQSWEAAKLRNGIGGTVTRGGDMSQGRTPGNLLKALKMTEDLSWIQD